MEYSYLAIDKAGFKQKGKLETNNQKEVVEYLRQNGMTPLKVKLEEKKEISLLNYFQRVRGGDIVLFTRQLSSMITTGLTVIESLTILKQQANKPQMQKILNGLIASLSEGDSLSQALSKYPNEFSSVYVALIRAAEEGGILDKVLERLATNLEKSAELKGKVKSALFYPAIIISGVLGVLILMNIFVIPQMGALYESLDLELPLMTRIVLFGSKLTTTFLPFTLIAIFAAFFLFKKFEKTPRGILLKDKVKLKVPVFGGIMKLSSLDESTRTLSLLVSSGTSLISAIGISAEVAGNIYYRNAFKNTATLVEKGVGLSDAMQNQNIFPPVMLQMVKVGETTGKIDESLLKIAEYFERDLDLKVKTLTTSIEPILIIVLGVSVAFLIMAVITPIYSLISQIQ